jgi:hypothetical protein
MRYPNEDSKKIREEADKVLEEDRKLITEIEDGTADFDDDDEGEF